jgi:hypothetical protein
VLRRRPLLSSGCVIALIASSLGPAAAARSGGVVAGTKLEVARSGAAVVRTLARDGSIVRVRHAAPQGGSPGAVTVDMKTTRAKTARDAAAYRRAGRSVVGDLVALGMPAAEARRQFGDMETLDAAAAPPSGRLSQPSAPAAAAAAAAITPYDTQCAAIDLAGGKITGYGCATFYLVRQSGADWWLTTKMKVSAHSSDESWFYPKRLTQLGWRVSWGNGNTLYDWDPYSTRSVGQCLKLTVRSTSPYGDVSVQGNICPESLGPWSVTTARSGGIWNGLERGTDYEGALATQAVHSPPGVPVSYQSAWTLSYCDLWCI